MEGIEQKMFRLLKLFKNNVKKSVLAIVLLLIVQAYSDLALPQYTSDIVDVGIQQGGITYAAPEWMRGDLGQPAEFNDRRGKRADRFLL